MRRAELCSNASTTSFRATPASMAVSRRSPMSSAFLLDVRKRNLTELPALVAKIQSFYGGTLLDAERFLTDHDVRYVVWSVRESKNIDAWKSIMQAVDADYRWMEFSPTPEAHVGLWVRRWRPRYGVVAWP